MFTVFVWVFAISGLLTALCAFSVLHLRRKYPFLRKRVRVEVRTANMLPDKTDIDGNPLYEIDGKIQRIPHRAACQAYQNGLHPRNVSRLYIHLNGTVDAEKSNNEVIINESTVLLENDYVIQTKRDLKIYEQNSVVVELAGTCIFIDLLIAIIIACFHLFP